MGYEGFDKLKDQLAAKGASNPGALAAYIGRKKYGKENFQAAAAKGKSLKGSKPKNQIRSVQDLRSAAKKAGVK